MRSLFIFVFPFMCVSTCLAITIEIPPGQNRIHRFTPEDNSNFTIECDAGDLYIASVPDSIPAIVHVSNYGDDLAYCFVEDSEQGIVNLRLSRAPVGQSGMVLWLPQRLLGHLKAHNARGSIDYDTHPSLTQAMVGRVIEFHTDAGDIGVSRAHATGGLKLRARQGAILALNNHGALLAHTGGGRINVENNVGPLDLRSLAHGKYEPSEVTARNNSGDLRAYSAYIITIHGQKNGSVTAWSKTKSLDLNNPDADFERIEEDNNVSDGDATFENCAASLRLK